jgi:hypothetical protein
MPVVRRRIQNRVYIIKGIKLSKVTILDAHLALVVRVHTVARRLSPVGFYIADSNNLHILEMKKIGHVAVALRANAHAAQNNPVAGRNAARIAECR